jgi:glycosyltransferase involved in cell wall biosynthesis
MYRGVSAAAVVCVLNEEGKVGEVLRRMPSFLDEVIVVDDGCTDRSPEIARAAGATVLSLGRTLGAGAALRAAYHHILARGHDVAVMVAGNNKDAPEEIPLLLDPIADGRADFVQGSRFLKIKPDFGPMPAYRKVATRVHPLLFSLVTRHWVTESTNGFRAVHRRILADPRIDLGQRWLDEYELEPYLYIRTIQCGYRTAEVAVTKTYPPRKLGQTKMKPVVGWWSILKPLFLVGLGLRK